MFSTKQNVMTEFSLSSSTGYKDPFNEITVDAVFTAPDGSEKVVPAFWAGGDLWKVRYSSPILGKHHFRTLCSDASNTGLHGQEGDVEVEPYEGNNPLFLHGALKVSSDRKHLEHEDGTPFFWLGDVWWQGLVKRFRWPEDFHTLTADRVAKGFTVVQIVGGGLQPEITEDRFWSHWSANEAGWAWEKDFTRINPSFFDMADLRIGHLVHSGLMPCLVSAWGYYIRYMGVEKMKKHWRYLVARYGAYPLVWCLVGEMTMPPYDSTRDEDEERKEQFELWTGLSPYLKELDPYGRLMTIHRNSFRWVDPRSLVDIDMIQTGHTYFTLERAVRGVIERVSLDPPYPVVMGESNFEGEYGTNWDDVQRLLFWCDMLSGLAGFSYGASSIWQFNTRKETFIGIAEYNDNSWEEAMQLRGSKHLGIGKKFLERFPYWEFQPRTEPEWDSDERIGPFAAGIPGRVWMIYLCSDAFDHKFWGLKGKKITLERDVRYRASFFNPRDGSESDLGEVKLDSEGKWAIPDKPTKMDLVLVLNSEKR